jgi:zinc D-Ala-D-Ala carboxypeptidase
MSNQEYPSLHDQLMPVFAELGISTQALMTRGMQVFAEAELLEVAEVETSGKTHYLIPQAAHAWKELKSAALEDGISIYIVSAFRSVDRQIEIIRRKLGNGQEIEKILEVNAPPGFSEHHTGRAIDVATLGGPILEVEFEHTPAFDWLNQHAHQFGFFMSYPAGNLRGYQYEPWHWCFNELTQANTLA